MEKTDYSISSQVSGGSTSSDTNSKSNSSKLLLAVSVCSLEAPPNHDRSPPALGRRPNPTRRFCSSSKSYDQTNNTTQNVSNKSRRQARGRTYQNSRNQLKYFFMAVAIQICSEHLGNHALVHHRAVIRISCQGETFASISKCFC